MAFVLSRTNEGFKNLFSILSICILSMRIKVHGIFKRSDAMTYFQRF